MATGQTFLSLNNSRRQRGLHSNHHHHHNSHAFHHNANPFQNQLLNPLARAYHHLTANIPNATQPHHFHHNNAFHNAKTTDPHEDDSLSSVSMLSSDQTKRKVRWILSLGLLLPALAAIIGVVAWAVSAEVVMGVQREAALKNQQEFHNHGPDDFLLDQLETRKLSYNSDRFKFGKQRTGLARNVFGERINPNMKSLASTESKDNLIPSTIANSNSRMLAAINGNTDEDPNVNGLNQESKSTTKLLPTTINEAEADEKEAEEVDLKSKNSLENQNLQLNTAKNDRDSKVVKTVQETNNDKLIPIISATNNRTDLNEEKNDENDANEDNDNSNENLEDEKKTNTEEKPSSGEDGAQNDNKQPDSINEQFDGEKTDIDENEETSTPIITTKLTTKMQTTSSISDENGEVKTSRKIILNEKNEHKDEGDSKTTTKKSAGAQVAEVIDKIVAQRNGQAPPHIVVVAPFRLKNGNKRLTVTEGNVHGIPAFGSRSISAQNLAGFLSKSNKATTAPRHLIERTASTVGKANPKPTESTTLSTITTEDIKSLSSLDDVGDDSSDEAKSGKTDEQVKREENSEKNQDAESAKEIEDGNKLNEKKKADSNDGEGNDDEGNKENDESKSDDEETEEDEDSPSTTRKPVLINRIKEAVRTQAKKDKNLASKKENQKRPENPIEKFNSNASNKHQDKEEQQKLKTRLRKTSPGNNAENSIKTDHDDARNISSTIADNIRRIDEELPERLVSLDLTKDEDLFLEDGFLKKTTSLEKAFKELEKSKNLKYQEHEYTHQSKEQESYYGSSSNNKKQTIKPIIELQQITKPSSSPPPQPQINQHFYVNTQKSNNKPIQTNRNNNKNKNRMIFNKQFSSNHPQLAKFTQNDHRPSETSSFENLNNNNVQKFFNKGHAPAPASYNYQILDRKHQNHQDKMTNAHTVPAGNNHINFAVQQSQHQKQILNNLLRANAASSNQIQRSMNVNSGMNQLNHFKLSSNQRTMHVPKQQLIQHIQMLSNLNSKHTFPTAQSPQMLLNQSPQQTQNSISIIPTPSISPEQFVDLGQMMNYQEQNLRNLQNLQGMESGNNFMDSNNHYINVHPTKPQIHYADTPMNHFTDASNINPTNLPPQNVNNLQAAESIGHSQHSAASSNMLSVGDPSNSAVVNFNLKEPPGAGKGLHMSFGSGPSSGGAQLITNPLGIFKSIFLPLLPKPRMNLNGKVVFGVVLDTSLRKPAPKVHAPVIVVPPSKPHHFFG